MGAGIVGHISDYNRYINDIVKKNNICNMYINDKTADRSSKWRDKDLSSKVSGYFVIHEDDDKSLFEYDVYLESEIGNEAFLYDVAKFDPALWKITDGEITKIY